MEYKLNDFVEMKKPHPCRKSIYWEIIRTGVDIKIQCLGCGAIIMLERPYFERRLKKVLSEAEKDAVNVL